MTMGYVASIRNARLELVRDAVDAGSGAGKLLLYSGTRPATGAAVTTQTLLVSFELADPCMSTITGGVGTWDLDPDITATAETFTGTKTATWARWVDSDDTVICDGSVGEAGSGADVIMGDTALVSGQTVKATAGTLTEGNP
jgi:hypothetical protein